MGDTGEVAQHLADHDGVISIQQARDLNLSRHDIQGRLKRKEWLRLAYGVYRSASHEFSEAVLVRGAVLACGGVADRSTAAWWHGLCDDLPSPLTVSTSHRITSATWSKCEVDAVRRDFPDGDVAEVRGLPVTGLPLTVLMTIAAPGQEGAKLLDRVLQTKATTLGELEESLERNAGKRGMARSRELLTIAADRAESEAERIFLALLRDEEITGWEPQVWFQNWRLDFAWPAERLAVEIDGWASHSSHDAFVNDRRKGNALEAAGWSRLTFTWFDLVDDPIGCMEQVAARLEASRTAIA
ncbi:MAG: type IV toxin-antitoxin system AbiEi family antitoxin domain-containing protein [Gordonia sp. (in: high G+C Gram-positive bacteria)]